MIIFALFASDCLEDLIYTLVIVDLFYELGITKRLDFDAKQR